LRLVHETISDETCTTHGQAQKLEDARETFLQTAAQGLPGAYIEAQDSFTYNLQVAIPPLGITHVEVVLEQLLKQRLGEVMFEIPFAPNEKVDQIVLDLTVEDIVHQENGTVFNLDLGPDIAFEPSTSRYHLDIPDARQYALPSVLRGRYNPVEIPANGVLYTDGKCFEHFFHPSSLEPMKRNFVFVLDVSDSMSRSDSKLDDAKVALNGFIDTLRPEDTFAIQTFASLGTQNFWGSAFATDDEKVLAKEFINNLRTHSQRTNLHQAFLEGLLRAKPRKEDDSSDDTVTILMLVSDGRATTGETNRTQIAEDVYKLNREGTVKIFSLGFQGNADMELLDAIAIMNGGVSATILHGGDDFASQMQSFFESEFGTVLLSDVSIGFKGDVSTHGETQNTFPLLAEGYEIVVRGLLDEDEVQELTSGFLRAVTTASMAEGTHEWWTATAVESLPTSESMNSLCFQSYAHSRITQLLRLREAAKFAGDDLIADLVSLSEICTTNLTYCMKEEALSLALDANVVVKGLTAMVTIDTEGCLSFEGETEICREGSTSDGSYTDENEQYSSTSEPHWNDSGGYSYTSAPAVFSPNAGLFNLVFTVLCICFTVDFMF
jgi:hypothetical protein